MISVVPFEIDVNMGTSNVNASWLRWDRWDPLSYNCNGGTNANYMSYSTCLDHGYYWSHYYWSHAVGSPDHSQWNGCVSDRDKSYDVDETGSVPPRPRILLRTRTYFARRPAPAAHLQLEQRQQHHQRDVSEWCDKPDSWLAVGFAFAAAAGSAQRARGVFNQQLPARHHPFCRRPKHGRSLVW
jgi:hypothetical protein